MNSCTRGPSRKAAKSQDPGGKRPTMVSGNLKAPQAALQGSSKPEKPKTAPRKPKAQSPLGDVRL